ncbi:MAG: threonylcarbamoyl-AMP synthase [Chitinophagaceae bacterium]|nr:MAG: threonylcarbamoyl-AMP synthase [Chitinophagaceae bacterium]
MENFEQDLIKSLEVLQQGGIILYPTDTVWGLGCDATNEDAVQKIFELKQRPAYNAMIALVAGERDILKYVAAVDLSLFDYLGTLSRPTTVVYDGAIGLASNLLNADGSIGIRICREPFCRALVKRFRKPVVSTSANLSGQPTAAFFDEVDPLIREGAGYVVKYRKDDRTPASPSSVIRWNNGQVTVLRP